MRAMVCEECGCRMKGGKWENLWFALVMVCRVCEDQAWMSRIAFDDRKRQVATPAICEDQVEERMEDKWKSHRSRTCQEAQL